MYSPLPDVLRIAENLLFNGATLAKRTKLSVVDIMSALKLRLHSTISMFKNVIYCQMYGDFIGNCILPLVDYIFIKYVERQALTSFPEPPKISICHGDIFCAINSLRIDEFLQHINCISPNIQFIVEIENPSLPFLNVQKTNTSNNHISKTHTHQPIFAVQDSLPSTS